MKLVGQRNGKNQSRGKYRDSRACLTKLGKECPACKNAENKVLQDMPCFAANHMGKVQLLGRERRKKELEGGTQYARRCVTGKGIC
jgi:hypothetical protein